MSKGKARSNQVIFFTNFGRSVSTFFVLSHDMMYFFGWCVLEIPNVFKHRYRAFWSLFIKELYQAGPELLTGLITVSFLLGFALAIVSIPQFQTYGISPYVADLISLGFARKLGAIITVLILLIKLGIVYTADLRDIMHDDEVEQLHQDRNSIMRFYVLPRLAAMTAIAPFLYVFACISAIFGGAVASIGILHVSADNYFDHTIKALTYNDILVGLGQTALFGFITAFISCHQGVAAGRSTEEVGKIISASFAMAFAYLILANAVVEYILLKFGI